MARRVTHAIVPCKYKLHELHKLHDYSTNVKNLFIWKTSAHGAYRAHVAKVAHAVIFTWDSCASSNPARRRQ